MLDRDTIIKQVADAVGPAHSVDLKSYDHCILVEMYKVSFYESHDMKFGDQSSSRVFASAPHTSFVS